MVARGRKIQQLPERINGRLELADKLPLVDSSGAAHHTSLQSIKDLIGGSGGSSGVLVISAENEATHDLAEVNDFAILVDTEQGSIQCILPTPSLGKHFVFKKIDPSNNTVTIHTTSPVPSIEGLGGQPRVNEGGTELFTIEGGLSTINTTTEVKIDGQATQTLFQQYESLTLISDGTNWFIL